MVVVGFRCLLLAALWTLGCHEVQEAKEGGRALSGDRGPGSTGDPSPGTPPLHPHLTNPHRDWSYSVEALGRDRDLISQGRQQAQRPNDLPQGMHLENSHIEA